MIAVLSPEIVTRTYYLATRRSRRSVRQEWPRDVKHRVRTLPASRTALSRLDRTRQEHLGWLLGRADRLFARRVTRAVQARGFAGIRLVHIALIRNVDERGTRISEIARRAGMTKQATGQLVAEFTEAGYITVVSDPSDGRAKVARYTAKGRRLLRAIVASIEATERRCADDIGTANLAALKTALTRLLASAGAARS